MLSHNDFKKECELLANNPNMTQKCPHGEGVSIASTYCLHCNYYIGQYDNLTVYCSYLLRSTNTEINR